MYAYVYVPGILLAITAKTLVEGVRAIWVLTAVNKSPQHRETACVTYTLPVYSARGYELGTYHHIA